MLRSAFTELFGIEYPIVSAGMGGVAGADLAAAVSEAGGLGTIGAATSPPEVLLREIATARKKAKKPLAVNLLLPFLRPETLDALANEPIEAVTLFWGEPTEYIPRCKSLGLKVIWQCGSAAEAVAAKRAGADAIIAQGFEAGGHVRGVVTSLALIPAVRDAIGELPMAAAGGFADGRGLAAALALGADAAVFGTRFLASEECAAHPEYKRRVLAARADETVHTKLFDVEWPNAAHRVLRTELVDEWERAGSPPAGKRRGEGEIVAQLRMGEQGVELRRYSVYPPTTAVKGDLDGLPFYAGQSVSLVNEIRPAAEIVHAIALEAEAVIKSRLAALAR